MYCNVRRIDYLLWTIAIEIAKYESLSGCVKIELINNLTKGDQLVILES